MSTHSFPSQTGFDPMSRGIDVMADMLRAPATEPYAAQSKGLRSLFKKAFAAYVANREAAAIDIIARHDPRFAAELRAAKDRSELEAATANKA